SLLHAEIGNVNGLFTVLVSPFHQDHRHRLDSLSPFPGQGNFHRGSHVNLLLSREPSPPRGSGGAYLLLGTSTFLPRSCANWWGTGTRLPQRQSRGPPSRFPTLS